MSSIPLVASAAPAERHPPRHKAAASPEEAVELFAKAAKAGDMDAVLDQLGSPIRASWESIRSKDTLDAALDDRFGKDPERVWPTLREALGGYSNAIVRDRVARADGRVDLTVWMVNPNPPWGDCTYEMTWTASNGPTGWKLDFSFTGEKKPANRRNSDGGKVTVTIIQPAVIEPKKSTESEAFFWAAVRVDSDFAKDVRAGTYPTRQKAFEAHCQAMDQLRERMIQKP